MDAQSVTTSLGRTYLISRVLKMEPLQYALLLRSSEQILTRGRIFLSLIQPVISRNTEDGYILSTDNKMKQDFERVQNFSFKQDKVNSFLGFLWEIHEQFYQSDIWQEELPKLPNQIHSHRDTEVEYNHATRPYLYTYFYYHDKIKIEKRKGCMYTNSDTFTISY